MCCTWRTQAGLFEISLNPCVRAQKNTLTVRCYQRKVFKKRFILGWILWRLQNSGFGGWGDLELKIYGWTHGNLYFKMICCWKLFTGAKKKNRWITATSTWWWRTYREMGVRRMPMIWSLCPSSTTIGPRSDPWGTPLLYEVSFYETRVWLSNSTSLTFVKCKVCYTHKNNTDIYKVRPFAIRPEFCEFPHELT